MEITITTDFVHAASAFITAITPLLLFIDRRRRKR